MSKSSCCTKDLIVMALALTFWVGWRGAKDWVQSLSEVNHSKLLTASTPGILPFPSPTIPDLKLGTPGNTVKVNETYGKLLLSFEANHGQTDPKVKFLSRGKGYGLFLTSTEAVFTWPTADFRPSQTGSLLTSYELCVPNFDFRIRDRVRQHLHPNPATGHQKSTSLRMKLVGANPKAQVEGLEALPGKSNYFIGNDPGKWRTNVPTYTKIKYKDVYPGIDLIYYGNLGKLEYDWVVAPGADPRKIRLEFQGADVIGVDPARDLVMKVSGREVRQQRPRVYQQYSDPRVELGARYLLKEHNQVAFVLDPYDPTRPLVIDPVTVFATYLGGGGPDTGFGIAVDSEGYIVVAGRSDSADFPTSGGTVQSNFGGGGMDAFVTKLDPEGKNVVFSTYLGGSGKDYAFGVALDTSDNIYLAGATTSSDFPTRNALQSSFGGRDDAFVAKLSADGSHIVYSSYLGRSGTENASPIAVDDSGSAFVTGYTTSSNFPTVNPFQANLKGSSDVIVAKLSPDGTHLVYSTFMGGSQGNESGNAITVDRQGNAYT